MKKHLLLLHGAIGSAAELVPLAAKLEEDYTVHLFDFPGHGGKQLPDAPFSIQLFAEAALAYIIQEQLEKVVIFGYSMGGYTALYMARHYPQIIEKVICLGTKFRWTETIARQETKMLDADAIAAKVPAFAATLASRHAPNSWQEIVRRTSDMLLAVGSNNPLKEEDYPNILCPCLVMVGDRDKMAPAEETLTVYRALPDAAFAVLPRTPHAIEKTDMNLLAQLIRQF
ncbi:alpha/beta fold hydrolase [Sediminibacterium ginsengisoli]|nr:alpha/beta fold hydrolase [Sediminibacterium ginsengisoli]